MEEFLKVGEKESKAEKTEKDAAENVNSKDLQAGKGTLSLSLSLCI